MEINKYKADKLVTEHLSSLGFGGGNSEGSDLFIMASALSTGEIIKSNFEDAQIYLADASGKWGYSNGKAIVLIHPDIKQAMIIGRNNDSQILEYGVLRLPSEYEDEKKAEVTAAQVKINVLFEQRPEYNGWMLIVGPSVNSVESLSGPVYDVRNFKPFNNIRYEAEAAGAVLSIRYMSYFEKQIYL